METSRYMSTDVHTAKQVYCLSVFKLTVNNQNELICIQYDTCIYITILYSLSVCNIEMLGIGPGNEDNFYLLYMHLTTYMANNITCIIFILFLCRVIQ